METRKFEIGDIVALIDSSDHLRGYGQIYNLLPNTAQIKLDSFSKEYLKQNSPYVNWPLCLLRLVEEASIET
jgi:hypothetical protein